MGGLIGIAVSCAVGSIINFGVNFLHSESGRHSRNSFSLPLWLVASAFVFSIPGSLAAGSDLASRAQTLDPIRALRHD
jgi:ABC-type antimicrobial peptide transport system permease subunit